MATPTHLLPGNEEDRLRALWASDAAAAFAEPVFQELVALVAYVYQLPSAFISAVGSEQVDFLATHGVPGLRTLSREQSLCSLAVGQQHTVALNHLLTAPENAHQRTAQQLGMAAYVGVPITVGKKLAVGVFCVSSPVPREFSAEELAVLEELAALVSDLVLVRHRLLGQQAGPQWQALQQLVAASWQPLQALLGYLAQRHAVIRPTSLAVLGSLRQRLSEASALVHSALAGA